MGKCPVCGTETPGNSKFCLECGYSFSGGSQTGQLIPDTILENRYIIVKTLGRGGMGAVYMALDQRLNNRSVAIKEMSTQAVGGDLQAAIGAFKKEASMLVGLEHSALPRILDFFSKGEDRWYLVMEYIDGQTLAEDAKNRGPIPEAEVLDWAIQLCEILDYLHNQQPPIIFRDLKPANIMLTPKGQIKLIDFGIARHFRVGSSADTIAYGSHGFAPPEQYGENQTSPSSDIYALGATMHYLLTGVDPGKNPFVFEPPSKTIKVSPRFETTIMKALEIRAEDRFENARDIKKLLVEAKNEMDIADEEVSSTKIQFNVEPKPDINILGETKQGIVKNKGDQVIESPSEAETIPIMEPFRQDGEKLRFEKADEKKPNKRVTKIIAAVMIVGIILAGGAWYALKMMNKDNKSAVESNSSQLAKSSAPAYAQTIMTGHTDGILKLAFSPDSEYIASASRDNSAIIWDAATGEIRQTLKHDDMVLSVAFSPDGRRLATGCDDKRVRVWDVATGNCIQMLTGQENGVSAVAFSNDGQKVIGISRDGILKVWKVNNGNCLRTLQTKHQGDPVEIAPNMKDVATCYNYLSVLDLESGNTLHEFHQRGQVIALAFNADGTRLVSGTANGLIKVWDLQTGKCLHSLSIHRTINAVAFGVDDKTVASGHQNKYVKIWDVNTGKCLETLTGPEASVWSLSFSPNGEVLAAGSDEGNVVAWKIAGKYGSAARCWEVSPDQVKGTQDGIDQNLRFELLKFDLVKRKPTKDRFADLPDTPVYEYTINLTVKNTGSVPWNGYNLFINHEPTRESGGSGSGWDRTVNPGEIKNDTLIFQTYPGEKYLFIGAGENLQTISSNVYDTLLP